MDDRDAEAGRRKIIAMIEGIDYALLTTRGSDGAPLHARPMAYRAVENDGDLWFFTRKASRKVKELAAEPRLLVSFADPRKQNFVSITGWGEVVSERSKVKALWSELYRAWFPGGPDDEDVVLIRVHAERAEYWDTPTGVMVYAFGYIKALTTGKASHAGEIGTVDLA